MHPKIEVILDELNAKLHAAEQLKNPLDRVNEVVSILHETCISMREYIKSSGFNNHLEEIEFFKTVRPVVLSRLIEEGIEYNLMLNKPITTVELQIQYLEEQLISFQGFFRINSFHYQYYKNKLNDRDEQYFLRSAGPLDVPLTDIPENDSDFTTPMSGMFSKFIAYEHVQRFILHQITLIKQPELDFPADNFDPAADLRWTGDAVNMIELVYGIYLTGQLNNGNVSLNQVVRWMEKNLKVTIGNIQSRFAEISSRKRVGPTKYIDQIKQAILKKLEDDNRL